jgi:hypothetical protein
MASRGRPFALPGYAVESAGTNSTDSARVSKSSCCRARVVSSTSVGVKPSPRSRSTVTQACPWSSYHLRQTIAHPGGPYLSHRDNAYNNNGVTTSGMLSGRVSGKDW